MLISQLFIFLCFDYFYYLHFVNCTIWSRAVVNFYKSYLQSQSRVGKWATLICFSGLLDKYMDIYCKIFLSRKLVYCGSFAKYCNLWNPAGWLWCWCYLVVIPRPGYCSFIKTWIRESLHSAKVGELLHLSVDLVTKTSTQEQPRHAVCEVCMCAARWPWQWKLSAVAFILYLWFRVIKADTKFGI